MKLFDVDFVGGDFNMAVKGPVADVFSDAEFMAPGSSPLWGAGGLEGDNVVCTGFLCMPRRTFHWLVNKHGIHTFSNDRLGLNERDESTHDPVFMHLWATYLLGGTRAALRSDAAQSRRLLNAVTKNDRKRQRRLKPSCREQSGRCNKYRHSGTVAIHTVLPKEAQVPDCFTNFADAMCDEWFSDQLPARKPTLLFAWMQCASSSQSHCLTLMRTYRTKTCPTLSCASSRATTSVTRWSCA